MVRQPLPRAPRTRTTAKWTAPASVALTASRSGNSTSTGATRPPRASAAPPTSRSRPSTPPCAASSASRASPSPGHRRRSIRSTSGRCGASSTAISAPTRPSSATSSSTWTAWTTPASAGSSCGGRTVAAGRCSSRGSSPRQTHIGTFRFPSCIATDLAIAEAASPDPVLAGEILSYAITVTNNGSNPATNVVVVDVLPAGTSFLTSAVPCAAPPASPNARTCALGALRPGEARPFPIQVRVDPAVVQASGAGVLNNTASVSADEPDPDLSNNTLSVSTIVNDRADLRLTKACEPDEPLRAGTTATCEILVDNLGPSHARNVVVRHNQRDRGP